MAIEKACKCGCPPHVQGAASGFHVLDTVMVEGVAKNSGADLLVLLTDVNGIVDDIPPSRCVAHKMLLVCMLGSVGTTGKILPMAVLAPMALYNRKW